LLLLSGGHAEDLIVLLRLQHEALEDRVKRDLTHVPGTDGGLRGIIMFNFFLKKRKKWWDEQIRAAYVMEFVASENSLRT
jgi:hypothetical protein